MRLCVFGGRHFSDRRLFGIAISDALNWYPQGDEANDTWLPPNGTVIIHGDCPTGADAMADSWAIAHWVPVQTYPADWDTHGRAAGPIRNQKMIDEGRIDAALALPGGRGTADMMRRLKAAGIPIVDYSTSTEGQTIMERIGYTSQNASQQEPK